MTESLHEKFGQDAPKVLRGSMMDQADKTPLPERFRTTYNPDDSPSVIITDTTSGRSVVVSLFALAQVRQTLNALFG